MTSSFSLNEPGGPGAPGICKRPGCGNPLPPAGGRGRARQFCSPACARRFHNAARRAPASADPDPLAALESLLRQAAPLLRAARARNRHRGAGHSDGGHRADGRSADGHGTGERGSGRPVGEAAGTREQIEALTSVIAATRAELAAVRDEIAALRAELARRGPPAK